MINEKLSVEEIAAMYVRLKSRCKDASKIWLDWEQLLFHALSGLSEQELSRVKEVYLDSGQAGSAAYRVSQLLEGVEPRKFPEHDQPQLDPDSRVHPSLKVKRF